MAESGARQAKTNRAVSDLISALTSAYEPGDLLPSIAATTERFAVSENVVRVALKQMRDDGLVVTENGVGSRLCATAPAHIFTRTAENPHAHLAPTAPPQATRGKASEVLSDLFALRKGALIYTLRQAATHRATGAPAQMIRIIPVDSVMDLDPAPDPHGDRAELIKALTAHYGVLETHFRARTIPSPAPDIRTELDIRPHTPVEAFAIATRTRSGRLLMTETEYTIADPTIEWEGRLY